MHVLFLQTRHLVSPEVVLDRQIEREQESAFHEQREHVPADDVPLEGILEVLLAEDLERVGDDLIARHVDETASKAVLW